jgi:hypothetical protein
MEKYKLRITYVPETDTTFSLDVYGNWPERLEEVRIAAEENARKSAIERKLEKPFITTLEID